MTRRRALGSLLAGLLVAGCGGRLSPVTFASGNMDLAKGLATAVGKKDMKQVKRYAEAAERRDVSNMANDEKEAIKWIVSACEKGDWDAAGKYLDQCLASGK